MIYNSSKRVEVENLTSFIERLDKNAEKLYIELEKRYRFNLLLHKDKSLTNFEGAEVRVEDCKDTQKFCFRQSYIVKSELFKELGGLFNTIQINNRKLNFKNSIRDFVEVASNTFYKKIDLPYKTSHIKVVASFDNIISVLEPIGVSTNSLPFVNKGTNSDYSGWWIDNSSVFVYISRLKDKKKITLNVYFGDDGEEI